MVCLRRVDVCLSRSHGDRSGYTLVWWKGAKRENQRFAFSDWSLMGSGYEVGRGLVYTNCMFVGVIQ